MAKPLPMMKVQQLRQEFAVKSDMLAAHFQTLSPFEYFDFIFGDRAANRLYVVENKTYSTAAVDDLFDLARMRADIYVPPCDFFNDYYSMKPLRRLYPLVIDIDNMAPMSLEYLIAKMATAHVVTPTMIGNSGSGIHLYYVFNEPVDAYKRRIPILKSMVGALSDLFRGHGKVDRNSLIQAYRLPGSQTKLGDTMIGYQSGPAYDALELAKRLGVDASQWERVSSMEQPPKENENKASRQKKAVISKKITAMPRVNNGTKFYDHCTWRVFRETEVSHRYTSMVGLAIVAYKARIPRATIQRELELLAGVWSERNPENPVDIQEVYKAMKAYSPEYVKVSSAQLEEYFGWKFLRKIPRRGRTQEEHLQRARAVKDALITLDKRKVVEKYLKMYPSATKSEVARKTGLSRNTVARYWPT